MDYEYLIRDTGASGVRAQTEPRKELTGRQRNVMVIARAVANDMDLGGTVSEQHTAALLALAVDAISRGYEAELVALARAWRREVEAGGDGQR